MKRTRFLFAALLGVACGWSAAHAVAQTPFNGQAGQTVPPGALPQHSKPVQPVPSGYGVPDATTPGAVAAYGNASPGVIADGDTVYGGEWHHGYYHTMWGRPVALVVPPEANYQTNYAWGVGNTTVTPIYPQFYGPSYVPVTGYTPRPAYLPTPYWPSDTRQFGVYYIRGPW